MPTQQPQPKPTSASSSLANKETTTEIPEDNTAPTPPAPDLPVESFSAKASSFAKATADKTADKTGDKKAMVDIPDVDVSESPTPPSVPQNIPSPSSSSAKASSSAEATADKTADRSNNTSFIQTLLIKARAKIQERKQKKLGKILELLETKPQITNQDVQKLLRVSSATSTRYLDILEEQNKIKQVGNTGKAVFYIKN